MPELQIDLTVANRFISSLSKSLQALCHGCMDFDSGIEIVGYININIDSGSKVDYVLNEKVLKSTTNSMTFVSNSFLAKKEQPKQTRDGACSPIPQPQVAPYASRVPPVHLNSKFQKAGAQLSPYSHNVKGPQKRTRADDLKLSHKKFHLQSHSAESPPAGQAAHSHLMPASASSSYTDLRLKQSQSDNSANDSTLQMNIKKETLEADSQNNFDGEHPHNPSDDQSLDSSLNQADTVQVKRDPDETNSGSGNTFSNNDSDNAVADESADFKGNFLETSLNDNQQPGDESCSQLEPDNHGSLGVGSEVASKEHSLADGVNVPSTSRVNVAETDVDMSSENEPASAVSVDYDKSVDDGSYYQPGYDDAGEGSSDAGQFEVIEIDDEDEDVQAMFGDQQRKRKQKFHHSEPLPVNPSMGLSANTMQSFHARSVHASTVTMVEAQDLDQFSYYQNTQCPHCPETLPWNVLKQHISQCHGHEMPFVCSLCGKGFLTSSGLSNHMQAHEGRKFMCPICDFRFKQKGHLKQHLKSIHKVAQCTTCSQAFNLETDEVEQHNSRLTNVGTQQAPTPYSQYLAVYPNHLQPFGCTICGKGFRSRGGLQFHLEAHKGRQFVCTVCGFRFKHKHHMKDHLRNVHKLRLCSTCNTTFRQDQAHEFNVHIMTCRKFK